MAGNYIIKLRDNKWFVGYASDVDQALYRTWNGGGALWTQQHPPIEVIDIIPGNKHTKALTLMMMKEYGIDNVRGHCWSQRVLTEGTKEKLAERIC